jgi:DNA polymerase I-like protein with 3'-5' exonuclease and polymerase domains
MDFDYINNAAHAQALARDLKKCKLGAVDTETEGFDRFTQRLILLQISDGKNIWLIDRRKVDLQIFKPWLEDPAVEHILHNSFFDCCWLAWEMQIFLTNIYDTMYGERIITGVSLPYKPPPGWTQAKLEELKPQYSAELGYCLERRNLPSKFEFEPFAWFWRDLLMERKASKKHAAMKVWVDERHALQLKGFKPTKKYPNIKKSKEIVWRDRPQDGLKPITDTQKFYSARDVEFLHILREDQLRKAKQLDLLNVIDLENRLCEVTYHMSHNGFGVDSQRWLDYTHENEKVYNGYMEQLRKYADINWGAPAQVCKYFGVKKIEHLEQFEEATNYFKLAK